jgi:hypothetical protein
LASDSPSRSSDIVRVLLADLPGILNELVSENIQAQPDMVLVRAVQGWQELLSAGGDADVVILGAQQVSPLPGICSHLLVEYPDMRILVLTPNGDQAALYWLGLRQQQLGELSTQELIENVRRAYRINPAT